MIPAGSSKRLHEEAVTIFTESGQDAPEVKSASIPIAVFFDPAVMPGFRTGLTAQLRMSLERVAMQAKVEQLQKTGRAD